jgi:hypothetical protein
MKSRSICKFKNVATGLFLKVDMEKNKFSLCANIDHEDVNFYIQPLT